jgi:hypothetical protein
MLNVLLNAGAVLPTIPTNKALICGYGHHVWINRLNGQKVG